MADIRPFKLKIGDDSKSLINVDVVAEMRSEKMRTIPEELHHVQRHHFGVGGGSGGTGGGGSLGGGTGGKKQRFGGKIWPEKPKKD